MNSSAFSSKTSSISSTSLSMSSLSFLPASTTLALALASSFGCAPPRLVSVFFSCFSMRPPSTKTRRQNQVGVSLSSRYSAYPRGERPVKAEGSDDARHDQQRHDVDDLDHRVDGGTRRVLVRVADRVAGDGGLALVRPFAPLFLNVLPRVVPRAAAAGHRDGDEKPGHDRPEQHATQGYRPEDEAHQNGREHGDRGRHHHLLDCGLRHDIHAGPVFWLAGAFHDPLDLSELAADFGDDFAGGNAHRLHAQRRSEEHTSEL